MSAAAGRVRPFVWTRPWEAVLAGAVHGAKVDLIQLPIPAGAMAARSESRAKDWSREGTRAGVPQGLEKWLPARVS